MRAHDRGERLLKALRARLGRRVAIMALEAYADGIPDLLERTGRAAHGLYIATLELPPTRST